MVALVRKGTSQLGLKAVSATSVTGSHEQVLASGDGSTVLHEMSEDPRLQQFSETALNAAINDLTMQVVLKGGETLEGVPEEVSEDATNAALPGSTPEEEAHFGPIERVVTINGTSILAQEVEQFRLLS
jgi:hypothetical protein